MATNPIGGESAIVTLPGTIPPMPAVARILSRYDRGKLAAFVTIAIDLLDVLDGDPDREGQCNEDEVSCCTDLGRPVPSDEPGCEIADAAENAWIEWHTMRGSQKRGPNITQAHEDNEDDDPDTSAEDAPEGFDPDEDRCPAGDDNPADWGLNIGGPNDDDERQQMVDDVPCIPVVSLEPNIFNGQRQLLGYTLPRPTPNGIEAEL